jgi:hypothetical protein
MSWQGELDTPPNRQLEVFYETQLKYIIAKLFGLAKGGIILSTCPT